MPLATQSNGNIRNSHFQSALFEAFHIEKELLIANGHLLAGTRVDEILDDIFIDTAGLQTATADVNHIHKARNYVQLSVVSIYTCLKEGCKVKFRIATIFVGGGTLFI